MSQKHMADRLSGIVAKVAAVVPGLALAVEPVAASHGSVDCTIADGIMPLFEFLHTLEQLLMVAGIGVGMIGFLIAAMYIMAPGEDATRRGKNIAKHVLIGVVLLLSAKMVMAFLITQFPVC